MTAARVWTWIRWPLAIIGLLLIVRYAAPRSLDALGSAIEFGAEEGSIFAPEESPTPLETGTEAPEPSTPTLVPPEGPVTDGSATPEIDFHVEDTIADVDSEQLLLSDGEGDAIVMAFPLPEGSPACMASMTLTLTVEEVLSTTEVGLFHGDIPDVRGVGADQLVDGEVTLGTPLHLALLENPGVLELDVLTGYQNYFTEGLPEGTPYVLVVQATSPVDVQGGVAVTASEAEGDGVPTLSWTAVPGCGEDGTAGTEAATSDV